MADVNTSILTALEAGYDPQEIMDHIKKSEDPLHQEWYSNYAANMADRSKEQSVGSIYYNDGSGVQTTDQIGTSPTVKPTSTTTPVLDWAQTLTPVEAGAVVAGTVGVAKAPGLINAYQERKIKKEELAQKERSLAAYEAQVAKQGMVGQPAGAPMSTEPPPLSPYEQARIETERARADLIRSKIAQTERESAAREAKAKADAERKAANVPTPKAKEPVIQLNAGTTGVAPTGEPMPVAAPMPANPAAPLATEVGNPPKDMPLVKAGEANTVKNLIAEEIKPAPAIAATPPEIAPMAIEPSTATTEVTPTKAVETPEQIAAKKEATTKAVLGTEPTKPTKPAKWPGGAEGSAAQLFGGTKKNFTSEAQASLEMFKDYVGKPITMPPSGGSIHQIEEVSKFYEKYTGKPLPRSPEGKLVPIPESQIKQLHASINTELSDAVKGNKLGNLGKGALAAVALLGLTEAVQAAQKGDFGPLRQAGFDIGGPVAAAKLGLGLLSKAGGAGFSALTYTGDAGEANESAQVARRFAEAQKLGSPYRSVPPPR
jgi:hypothetical protein